MTGFVFPTLVQKTKKRLGRGHGSGKVKTSGRGQKGQKARGRVRRDFEGGQSPLTKRLPFLRGKGRNASMYGKPFALATQSLSRLPEGTTITIDELIKAGLVKKGVTFVKLVGSAKLTQALTVTIPCSKTATEAIEKAGGTVNR